MYVGHVTTCVQGIGLKRVQRMELHIYIHPEKRHALVLSTFP